MTTKQAPRLQTERLTLRPLVTDDAEALFPAFSDPETMRYMDQPPHTRMVQTREHLAHMLSSATGCWWAITATGTDEPIGFVGYLGATAIPGMGYLLRRADWRQGYMTEAVHAALGYGFTTLDFDRVELWINDGNIASQRLAERTGFTRRAQFRMRYHHQRTAHDKLVYGLYRYEWQAHPNRVPVQPRACYGVQPILAVPSVQESADYYCDQLGFRLDFLYGDPPTHGAVTWHDWSAEGAIIQLSEAAVDSARKEVGLFFFVGPEIDALYEQWRARGLTIAREIANQPWGMREFTLEDCNGYLLRFGTPA